MRIIHFIYDHINNPWVGGGGAVRVFEVYRRLAKKGYSITVVSGKHPKAQEGEAQGIRFLFLGSDKNYILSTFSYALRAKGFLDKHYKDYDLIVEDFAPWNPICAYRYQDKKPVVLQLQNYEGINTLKKYALLGLPFLLVERYYPKRYNHVISLSEFLNRVYNIKAKVIPSGVDKVEENFELGDYVAYLGRLDIAQKGLDLLAKAIKELKHIKFKIAGDGKDKERFLKMIDGCKNVEYLGRLTGEKKFNFIKGSKFLVMPSRYEGQGIVAMESASCGKPIIVSDIPVFSYVVQAGFGVSFRKDDPKDLAEKIKFLYEREDMVFEMGKKGIEFAKNYTWDRIAYLYEEYIKSLL
jgi:glycosyltransferase involved in cell wall biosynthesis